MQDFFRVKLEEELKQILLSNRNAYIYGAGVVGQRFYRVIVSRGYKKNIKGFIVSRKQDDCNVEEKKIICIDEVINRDASIFVAVGDAYQNEIFYSLKRLGFRNVINVYVYSFLDEKYICKEYTEAVPENAIVNINELMMMQFYENEFLRYDILLYLDSLRERKEAKSINDFYEINVGSNLLICDNGEKVALALYNEKEDIYIKHNYEKKEVKYNACWMNNNFPEEKCLQIEGLLQSLKKEWRRCFIGIIWPTAYGFSEQLVQEMKLYSEIERTYDIEFSSMDKFRSFVSKVYSVDDTNREQIEEKILRMEQEDRYVMKIVEFYIDNPGFYIKRYGHTISKKGIEMKTNIRKCFQKEIENYVFDVIVHTTDNYSQAEELKKIIEGYMV